jgi:tRNA U55 pseudouridine synthase TruB
MTDEMTSIEDRIERQQSQEMNITVVDTDPVIVQVHNTYSDRIHTVVPSSAHCSCEDHTYRGAICKHMLELLQHEGHIGEITRESIKQEREAIQTECAELQRKLDTLRSQRTQISAALDAVGASHAQKQTEADILAVANDEQIGDVFSEMVADLTSFDGETGGADQ